MRYRDSWDLTTIPDGRWASEHARRNSLRRTTFSGGRAPSCVCGKCRRCKQRIAQQDRREALRELGTKSRTRTHINNNGRTLCGLKATVQLPINAAPMCRKCLKVTPQDSARGRA